MAAAALLVVALATPGGSAPASASSGLGPLTVVATGGAAASPTTWEYDSDTGVLSVKAEVDIGADVLVPLLDARDLTVEASFITVSADVEVVATAGSHDLVLKSEKDVVVAPGARLVTRGGDIVLWADSTGDLSDPGREGGGIRIGADQVRDGSNCNGAGAGLKSELLSNGGDIILSGGDVESLDALRTGGFASYSSTMTRACSDYFYAVGIFNAVLDAAAGDIVVRGDAKDFNGMVNAVIVGGAYGALTDLRTEGSGSIALLGDASRTVDQGFSGACGSNPSRNPWGLVMAGTLQSVDGPITLTGVSNGTRGCNPRGIVMEGAAWSTSGSITATDGTADQTAANAGPFLNGARFGKRDDLPASSSDVTVIADVFLFVNNARVETSGHFTLRPNGASFRNAVTYPILNLNSSSIGRLTLGRPGNLANVTIAGAVDVPSGITIHGSTVALNGAVTTGAVLEVDAQTAVTQSAPMDVAALRLSGPGTFTLQNSGNLVGSVAGGTTAARIGDLSLVDSDGGLTVGVAGGPGVASVGPIRIETLVGDLTLVADLDTSATTDEAVLLNAGVSRAIGDETGGDIILVGSRTVSTGTGGGARFFSGSDSASAGLTALVGGVANTRIGVDETTTAFDPPLVSGGRYALYRSLELVVAGTGGPGAGDASPTIRLRCSPDPIGPGGTVTCEVADGEPSIDILWEASIDGGAFAGAGVRTEGDGTATFSFRAPEGSAGRSIVVELVGWGAVTTVDVVLGGPVPTRVDAGSGPLDWLQLALVVLLTVVLVGAPRGAARRAQGV